MHILTGVCILNLGYLLIQSKAFLKFQRPKNHLRIVLIKGYIEKTEIVGHILIPDLTMSISYAPSC